MESYSKKDMDDKLAMLRQVLQGDLARTRKMLDELEIITRSLERSLPFASFEFIERFNAEVQKIRNEKNGKGLKRSKQFFQ
jgi:hypothetical protein